MAVEVLMPKLGLSMDEGTVAIWNKKVGDTVNKGECIAEVSSEKMQGDLEAPADGVILDIVIPEGEGVPPGSLLCYIGEENEQINKNAGPSSPSEAQEEVSASIATVDSNPAPRKVRSNGKIKISPVARKMASEAGIDPQEIEGTGPGGRITKEDVIKAIKNKTTAPSPTVIPQPAAEKSCEVEKVKVTGIRKVISERMYESLQKSAQLTLNSKADVTKLLEIQEDMNKITKKDLDLKLSATDYIARAVCLALQKHKFMNSALIEDEIHQYSNIHLGIAVALEKGLVVPVVQNADQLTIVEISQNIKSVAKRARNNELSNDEMKGSTFTITNLGAYGIEHFTPILNTPETGILGVGAIEKIPTYVGEEIQKRHILPLSLTFDHRVIDGAPAAEFLQTVKKYLEEPFRMFL